MRRLGGIPRLVGQSHNVGLLSWLRSSRSLERTTRAGVMRAHNPVVGPSGDQDEIHLSEGPDRFRTEGELAG